MGDYIVCLKGFVWKEQVENIEERKNRCPSLLKGRLEDGKLTNASLHWTHCGSQNESMNCPTRRAVYLPWFM
jgi:hypothetical protein